MNDQASNRTELIERKIDKGITAELEIGDRGNLSFANLNQIMEVARVVAVAGVAIPKHLRENVGACLAVCIQASEWELSPFAVANKSYVVNDRIGYESQLVNAVILKRAPIVGRFKVEYSGDAGTPKRRCKVIAKLKDGDTVEYESPEIGRIPVQNSPLWKGDPDQQLFYYSSRAMCRRHFPDVILGIYTPDELAEEITTRNVGPVAKEPSKPKFLISQPIPEESVEQPPEPTAQPEAPPAPDDQDQREALLASLTGAMNEDGVSVVRVRKWAFKNKLAESDALALKSLPTESLRALVERWSEVKEGR